jgi:hypothetical protein
MLKPTKGKLGYISKILKKNGATSQKFQKKILIATLGMPWVSKEAV